MRKEKLLFIKVKISLLIDVRSQGSFAEVDWEALIGYVQDLEAAKAFIITCVVSRDSEFNTAAINRQTLLNQRWNWCYANN